MPKYFWTREEEVRLFELWKKGIMDPRVLANQLGRKEGAVKQKLWRMVVVVKTEKNRVTTTTEIKSKDLVIVILSVSN